MTHKNPVNPHWERIGDVPVDSGQVVIIDPSYIGAKVGSGVRGVEAGS